MNKNTLVNEEKLTFLMSEMVRSDLNIEKNPSIFSLAKGRGKLKTKFIKWKRKINDVEIECEIVVSPSLEHGNLTTEDQKVIYGLIKLWEKKDRPEELIFSLRELAEELSMYWSAWTYKVLKRSLLRLRFSAFTWSKSYFDGVTMEYYDELDSFTILAELKIAKNGKGKHVTHQACKIKFYPLIEKNLRSKYTQPSYYNVLISFKSGLAQLLYHYLELVMHNKDHYERNSKELLTEDLDLEGIDYESKSGRKRTLEIAIAEINGLPILSGVLQVILAETANKQDYKIIVSKIKQLEYVSRNARITKNAKGDNEVTSIEPPKTSTLELYSPTRLVEFFIERFGLRRELTKNELTKAQQVIEEHKMDISKGNFFVDYAKTKATSSNYSIKNFAGIVQYLPEAMSDYSKLCKVNNTKEAIKNCVLCKDIDGLIYMYFPDGSRQVMRCLHNTEKHKEIEKEKGVTIGSHKKLN
ncbi:MAG: hypothetical protein WAQ98_32405 [Blastocatellia bacterium]